MLEIADSFQVGAYRKVAKGSQMVTSPMSDVMWLWRHSGDVTTLTMLLLQQFVLELDHILT